MYKRQALAHQLLELQGHDIRGCFSRGDRDTLGRQLIVFGIEHRPLRTVAGVVRPDERRVDRERHRHILSRRIGQLRLSGGIGVDPGYDGTIDEDLTVE